MPLFVSALTTRFKNIKLKLKKNAYTKVTEPLFHKDALGGIPAADFGEWKTGDKIYKGSKTIKERGIEN